MFVRFHVLVMSILEIIMLICFGIAWPFSIRRSILSRSVEGKSFVFLVIIWFGYLSGILHKLFYIFDLAILLYIANFCMVTIDALLYFRNKVLTKSVKSECN